MKIKSLFIPLALGLGLTVALSWALGNQITAARAPNAPTAEWHVCRVGCDYSSVQAAVDASSSGDVIKVASGAYVGVSRIRLTAGDYVTQVVCLQDIALTIRGGYTTTDWNNSDPVANPTTLDAEGEGRVFYVGADVDVTIEGLNITGGDASESDSDENRVDRGGGVYASGAALVLINNTISGNTASLSGGGVYLRANDVTFSDNTVTGNIAGYGGGLFLKLNEYTSADLSGNDISINTATSNGGGLLLFQSNNATLNGNTIIGNAAGSGDGGGLYLDDSDATLINNVIADNDVGGGGGGLYIKASSPVLLHTVIANNGGDGVWVTGDSEVEMFNTILVSHTRGISVAASSQASLDATLWHANTTDWSGSVDSTRDLSGDPDFDAPGAGDYHIGNLSAALDRGVDAGVDEDMDGDIRPRGYGYDIGADEYPDLLSVMKQGSPDPARSGEQLVYTIRVTNYSTDTYTTAITDVLPSHVTFGEIITSWTGQGIDPGVENTWIETLVVTVEAGYNGFLTNTVIVTSDEGEQGGFSLVIGCYAVYMPVIVRNH